MKLYLIIGIIFFLSSCSFIQPKKQQTPGQEQTKTSPSTVKKVDIQTYQELDDVTKLKEAPTEQANQKTIPFDSNSNLWDKIPHLYKIPKQDKNQKIIKRINEQKSWYLKHSRYLYRVSERAEPYLYLIVEQLEQRNLPAELALLPIVESAYQAHVYSRGRAAGLWQFIPSTGKHFGLKQNWWYDGRRDIYAATNAALDYLEQLSKKFDGDWLLALASYNAGAGTVNKAIKKNRKKNKGVSYWDLKLPKETMAYVPKLLAIAQIIENLKANKVKLKKIKNEPFLGLVDCKSHIDLAIASKLAGISIDDLYKYNPGFNQWATNPEGPHHLLIPVKAVETFKKNLAQTKSDELVHWNQYTIKQGDSLSRIANKHGTTIAALKTANHLKNSRIRAGKTLIIPFSSKQSKFYSSEVSKQQSKIIAKINSKKRTTYRVKRGDSLWTIARRYKISYKKLAKANGISPISTLSIGQRLIIWSGSDFKQKTTIKRLTKKNSAKSSLIRYKVRKGDSLYTIARKHRVSIKQLTKWNQISTKKYLKLGQTIVIYTAKAD